MKLLNLFTIALVLMASCLQAQDIIESVEETFDGVNAIEVEGSFCQVTITGEQRSDVHLKGEILASRSYDIAIRHNVNGGVLRVWVVRPNMLRNVKGHIELAVPKSVNVRVENSSGGVYASNVGEGSTRLKASSGSIKAINIHSSVHATTSSGSIYLENIDGDAKTTSSSGSQKVMEIKGKLTAKASSGSLKVEQVAGEADLTTSSGGQSVNSVGSNLYSQASSGSLSLNNVTGNVNAETSSGSIRLSQITGAIHTQSSSGGQKGTEIKLTGSSTFRASSGGISMELINDADELSFALRASSGGLSAKGQSGRKQLTIDRGPIKVTGVTNSGAQSYR